MVPRVSFSSLTALNLLSCASERQTSWLSMRPLNNILCCSNLIVISCELLQTTSPTIFSRSSLLLFFFFFIWSNEKWPIVSKEKCYLMMMTADCTAAEKGLEEWRFLSELMREKKNMCIFCTRTHNGKMAAKNVKHLKSMSKTNFARVALISCDGIFLQTHFFPVQNKCFFPNSSNSRMNLLGVLSCLKFLGCFFSVLLVRKWNRRW